MPLKFSVVIPTRHRPGFIKESIKYLALQDYPNFEVIISDNYLDPALSCKKIVEASALADVKYVKPSKPLGMVENWNFALEHAEGDYVLYLTDKMILLPNTLSRLNNALSEVQADIVSWIDDSFSPDDFSDYFGRGQYLVGASGVKTGLLYERFDPKRELNLKASGVIARTEQDKSTYAKGKICFGAYSSTLIQAVKKKYGSLFFNIAPDYTSMILALSEANVCIELASAGIVHVNTNISNGNLAATNDTHAKAYLDSLDDADKIFDGMVVKNLYSSVNNMLTHDYGALKKRYELSLEFNKLNWLAYIYEDTFNQNKVWSSQKIEQEHKDLYENFVNTLSSADQRYLAEKISSRAVAQRLEKEESSKPALPERRSIIYKKYLKSLFPAWLVKWYDEKKQYKNKDTYPLNHYTSLNDAVLIKLK
jgi:glycosyltransferase involved in cell wall biosynthesis